MTEEEEDAKQRLAWRQCWGWDGPKIGEPASVDSVCVPLADDPNGKEVYAYGDDVIITQQLDHRTFIGEVTGSTLDWWKNGTRLRLTIQDIWPPCLTQQGPKYKLKKSLSIGKGKK